MIDDKSFSGGGVAGGQGEGHFAEKRNKFLAHV